MKFVTLITMMLLLYGVMLSSLNAATSLRDKELEAIIKILNDAPLNPDAFIKQNYLDGPAQDIAFINKLIREKGISQMPRIRLDRDEFVWEHLEYSFRLKADGTFKILNETVDANTVYGLANMHKVILVSLKKQLAHRPVGLLQRLLIDDAHASGALVEPLLILGTLGYWGVSAVSSYVHKQVYSDRDCGTVVQKLSYALYMVESECQNSLAQIQQEAWNKNAFRWWFTSDYRAEYSFIMKSERQDNFECDKVIGNLIPVACKREEKTKQYCQTLSRIDRCQKTLDVSRTCAKKYCASEKSIWNTFNSKYVDCFKKHCQESSDQNPISVNDTQRQSGKDVPTDSIQVPAAVPEGATR